MKIFNTDFFNKNIKLVKVAFSSMLALTLLHGCKSKESYEEEVFEENTHQIAEVKRDIQFKWGTEGTFGLTAPEGYKVVDYNYDMYENFQFQDLLYTNIVPVSVKNKDEFGKPLEQIEKQNEIYKPGTHTLVNINRNISIFLGKEETKELTAPNGYKIIDYDYSKTDSFDFETCTYTNEETVKVDDINDFGTPNKEPESLSNIRKPGSHTIVQINRNLTLWGKEERRHLTAPKGYKIVDYDYDKNNNLEFETIVYENIVPVKLDNPNQIGTPLESVDTNESDILEEENHVIVEITRNIDFLWGKEGTEYQSAPEGYKVLDYDYDKNEGFEFITRVYINTKPVKIDNPDNFGTPINQKTLTK